MSAAALRQEATPALPSRELCKVDLERHSKAAPAVCAQCGPQGERKGLCPFWRQA